MIYCKGYASGHHASRTRTVDSGFKNVVETRVLQPGVQKNSEIKSSTSGDEKVTVPRRMNKKTSWEGKSAKRAQKNLNRNKDD